MKTESLVIITNIHTNSRKPGYIYAEVRDSITGELQVSASLDYCVNRVKEILATSTFNSMVVERIF